MEIRYRYLCKDIFGLHHLRAAGGHHVVDNSDLFQHGPELLRVWRRIVLVRKLRDGAGEGAGKTQKIGPFVRG